MGGECSKYRVYRYIERTTPTLALPLHWGGDEVDKFVAHVLAELSMLKLASNFQIGP